MTVINPFDFFVEDSAATYPFDYAPRLRGDLAPYLEPVADPEGPRSPRGSTRMPCATARVRRASGSIDFLVRLNHAVQLGVAYTTRLEAGVQTPTRRSARPSAPAGTAPGCSSRSRASSASPPASSPATSSSSPPTSRRSTGRAGPSRTSPTSTPGPRSTSPAPAGWVWTRPPGCSPARATSRCARTPHPSAAAPISGSTDPVAVDFAFHNSVTRIHEDPRVTAPYSDDPVGVRRARSASTSTGSSPTATSV